MANDKKEKILDTLDSLKMRIGSRDLLNDQIRANTEDVCRALNEMCEEIQDLITCIPGQWSDRELQRIKEFLEVYK